MGGAIRRGRIVGEQVAVEPKTLNQNRDFPVLTEYRALLGGIFKRMYQLDPNRIEEVFRHSVPVDLDLV